MSQTSRVRKTKSRKHNASVYREFVTKLPKEPLVQKYLKSKQRKQFNNLEVLVFWCVMYNILHAIKQTTLPQNAERNIKSHCMEACVK